MAIHFLECAALTELAASKKLVLMACADSADKDSRIALPGLENICRWSGLKKSRALEVIAELVTEGLLLRRSSGRAGRRAEFYVFPQGCCPLHGPLRGLPAGSGESDSPSDPRPGSDRPDPLVAAGSDSGSDSYRTPSQLRSTSPLPPEVERRPAPPRRRPRPSRAEGSNPRAAQAAADRATRQQGQTRRAAERRARQQAIADCGRCSPNGYLPAGRVCDHDPDTPARAARGLQLIRAQLASR